MTKLIIVTREGKEVNVNAEADNTVMEIIRDNGVDELLALCGGSCSCATCHVYVQENGMALVGGPGDDENEILDSSDHRQENSRLSCQIAMTDALDGMKVRIAPED